MHARLRLRTVTVLLSFVGIATMSVEARADVSSWLEVGGGVGWLGRPHFNQGTSSLFRLETGMGTSPLHPLVVGGVLRTDSWIGHGTDLALLLRVADQGYASGDWGIGVDIGGTSRFWGRNSHGFAGDLLLGAPWGIQLQLGGSLASHSTRSVTAILGVDLARLTIYRQSGGNWWKNPLPLDRPVHSPGEEMSAP
jgi:hypothetical protein